MTLLSLYGQPNAWGKRVGQGHFYLEQHRQKDSFHLQLPMLETGEEEQLFYRKKVGLALIEGDYSFMLEEERS